MMFARVAFIACLLVISEAEYVRKKNCKDVDVTQCTVRSVIVDQCPRGPSFCVMKTNKIYGMKISMSPSFSASKLKLAIYGDVQNNGTFVTTFTKPVDGCGFLSCPLQADETRIFDVDLILNKEASGKFPVKFKIWNEDEESQACCFTFTAKVK